MVGVLIATSSLSARQLSIEEAREAAGEFLASKQSALKKGAVGGMSLTEAPVEATGIYAFNKTGGGYVIVSGDSRTYPILGYSDRGNIDSETMPAGLRYWLDTYSQAIRELGCQEVSVDREPAICGPRIEPLISSKWYQLSPYNDLCPMIPDDEGNECKSPSGCVATTMAQIMYYHQWPQEACNPIPEYILSYQVDMITETMTLPELPAYTFDWDNMLLTYKDCEATEAQNLAVAKLMQYCGQGIHMSYGAKASGADQSAIAQALRAYFGYDKGVTSRKRVFYTVDEWEQMIYDELAASRPVAYSGFSSTGGHSFVCDGYDGEGLFHINWGWDGNGDGFFRLSVLNPRDNTSVGSSDSHIGYCINQEVITGIQPPVEGSVQVDDDYYLYLYKSIGVIDRCVYLTIHYYSLWENNTVGAALATISEDGTITPVFLTDTKEVEEGGNPILYTTIDPAVLPQGETILYPVAHVEKEGAPWKRVASDAYYVKVTRTGDDCVVKSYPECSLDVDIRFENPEQAAGDEGKILVDMTFNREFYGPLGFYIFELGDVTAADPEINEIEFCNAKYFQYQCGYANRVGESEHVTLAYTPRLAGNLAVAIGDGSSIYPVAMSTLPVAGSCEFYDMAIESYDIYSTDGALEYDLGLRNNDTRTWDMPDNSMARIRTTLLGQSDYLYDYTKIIKPGKRVTISDMTNIHGLKDGDEVTMVVDQMFSAKQKKRIFEKTFIMGDEIQGGVTMIQDDATTPDVWYNLQGIRIAKPRIPGLYIHQGKKILLSNP